LQHFRNPRRVFDIGLASRHILDVFGVDHQHREFTLQDVIRPLQRKEPSREGRITRKGEMVMELTEETKQVYIETAKALKGSERRLFMARVVKSLGPGGRRRAARELGWERATIRKGMHELESG
jgi:hypothetical protein